jgi:restriction endonuclease
LLDFTELSPDGNDLELLTRELLFSRGFNPRWSGKGQDAGRDLLVDELGPDLFGNPPRTWLVSCKQKQRADEAVGVGDLDGIVEACAQHEAEGFLLVSSTYPSSGAIRRLDDLKIAKALLTHYWDGVTIERLLSTPRDWPIAQRFFPRSGNTDGWRIWATPSPNRYIANVRGFYFHLTNRIGSTWIDGLLSSLHEVLDALQQLPVKEGEEIRPRAVFYDDKHGVFTWYLDLLVERGLEPSLTPEEIDEMLGGSASVPFSDRQIYTWDITVREVMRGSDHYDPDHYTYYERDEVAFQTGRWRPWGLPKGP